MEHNGTKIKHCRELLGKTQAEVGKAVGLSNKTVSKHEREGVNDRQTIALYSRLFQVNLFNCREETPKWHPAAARKMRCVALDTSVLVNRFVLLEMLNGHVSIDCIFIPRTVIRELSGMKGKQAKNYSAQKIKVAAGLALDTINHISAKPGNKIQKGDGGLAGEAGEMENDERIIMECEQFSKELSCYVEIISLDKDFRAFGSGHAGIGIKTAQELESDLNRDELSAEDRCLFRSVESGDLCGIESCKGKINPRAKKNGKSLIYTAVEYRGQKQGEIIKALVRLGADLDLVDDVKFRHTPLCRAVQLRKYHIVRLLLESGADPDYPSQGKNKRNTAIAMAAYHKDERMVRLLMKYHPVLNGQDENGYTALMKACIRAEKNGAEINGNIIKILLEGGADIRIRDNNNRCAYGHLQHADPVLAGQLKELFHD